MPISEFRFSTVTDQHKVGGQYRKGCYEGALAEGFFYNQAQSVRIVCRFRVEMGNQTVDFIVLMFGLFPTFDRIVGILVCVILPIQLNMALLLILNLLLQRRFSF